MNTNSNTYTVIYSAILVIVVAAVLAFAAMSLKPLQDTNVKVETISKVLVAAEISAPDAKMSNEEVMKTYSSSIKSAILVNGKGEVKGTLSTDAGNIQIYTQSDLKAQNDIIKKIQSGDTKLLDDLRLPVYIFNVNGKDIPVVPCYGAGLWGPIWGYIAFEEDLNTVKGAIFDHKGETPGLGAEIANLKFSEQFDGEQIRNNSGQFVSIKVVKGGADKDDRNAVDAISGGTITSTALQTTLYNWLNLYIPYFNNNRVSTPAVTIEEE